MSFKCRVGGVRTDAVTDVQLLHALIARSTSSFVGALPVPISSPTTKTVSPSIVELAEWAEHRAGLAFARREAVRASGRAVLDVLRVSGR